MFNYAQTILESLNGLDKRKYQIVVGYLTKFGKAESMKVLKKDN